MKKFLLIILLSTYATTGISQTSYDSLLTRMKNMEIAVMEMSDNLDRCHRQFRTGTVFTVLGLMGAGATAAFINNDEDPDAPLIGYAISSALMLTGTILMIDSHKFIGDAGTITLSPSGIRIAYNLYK